DGHLVYENVAQYPASNRRHDACKRHRKKVQPKHAVGKRRADYGKDAEADCVEFQDESLVVLERPVEEKDGDCHPYRYCDVERVCDCDRRYPAKYHVAEHASSNSGYRGKYDYTYNV